MTLRDGGKQNYLNKIKDRKSSVTKCHEMVLKIFVFNQRFLNHSVGYSPL